MTRLAPYRKTIAALVVAAIGWATAVVASPAEAITATEWILGATGLAAALGVYATPNAQDA